VRLTEKGREGEEREGRERIGEMDGKKGKRKRERGWIKREMI
jgi:hypothetical protein